MLRHMRTTNALALLVGSLALSPVAAAQGHGGVNQSGMDQGEARIATRSDVRLSMESMPGTTGAQVSALGTRVAQRMAQIRECYEERVADDPTITGTLRLQFRLGERGQPNVAIDRDGVNDRGLVDCVSRRLARVDVARLRRPTHALVQLEFANTAARGAEQTAQRAQEAQQVEITIDANGNATATGGTPDGRIRFVLTGDGRESAPAVASAHRALRGALPGLMDCRRRAGRRQSPEGELAVVIQVREGRPPQSRVTQSTVADERARACVSRVLHRIDSRSDGTGRVQAQIHFSGASDE